MALEPESSSIWDDMDKQVGQLFMMGFDGTSVNNQVKSLIEDHHIGSILLTSENLKSAQHAIQLILNLQNIAHHAGHPVPLAIALEQENGGRNSLCDETYIQQFPSAMGLAAVNSKELAYEIARATGQELRAVGVNWIIGPVLNILTDTRDSQLGVRTVGDDPQEASSYGIEFVKGYREAGLATCGKTFPSLRETPVVRDLSKSQNLIPFQTAITQGLDAVMVRKNTEAYDDGDVDQHPSSGKVWGHLPRAEMHFDRTVVSECLGIQACCEDVDIGGGAILAIETGCDIVPLCKTYSAQQKAIDGLRSAIRRGRIDKSRILQSLKRVLNLKSKCTSWEIALSPAGINCLMHIRPCHRRLSSAAYNESITIARDINQLVPLPQLLGPDEELLLLTPLIDSLPRRSICQMFHADLGNSMSAKQYAGGSKTSTTAVEGVFKELGRAMALQRHGRILHTSYTASGVRPIHDDLIARASVVVVVTIDAVGNLYQNGFTKHVSTICRLSSSFNDKHKEKPLVVASVGSPYDFAFDESIGTYICTYDFTEAALHALVMVLYGEIKPRGTLPGRASKEQKFHPSRPHWLVECFKEGRDISHVEDLLKSARECRPSSQRLILAGASCQSFLLNDAAIEEAHFVVRDSNTMGIYGFCSSYFFKSAAVGAIGSIIVDPSRRRLSIGQSLHSRAISHLMQKRGIRRIQLGCRIPGIFLGVPAMDEDECQELKKWFAKMGWNTAHSQTLSNMILRNLPTWVAPDGLSHALSNPNVNFDLVRGMEYADVILQHVKRSSRAEDAEIYKLALADRAACAVINAKRPNDGSILGSLVLYKNDAKLATYIPALADAKGYIGGMSSPVISPSAEDPARLIQRLVLLGIRQTKKQGASAVVLHSVANDYGMDSLCSLGLSLLHSFEEMSLSTTHWAMNPQF